MQYFKKILIEQAKLHHSILPQDIVKLCYQATFGANHLFLNRDKAFQYFLQEYQNTSANSTPLFEPVSTSYVRCNLGAWKQLHFPVEWLFELFYHTASEKSSGTDTLFWNYITIAESLVTDQLFPFSKEEWQNYIASYRKHGVIAVHHSELYRANELPAYRLIHSKYTKLLPIIEKLTTIPNHKLSVPNNTYVIAIEGRAGAGKSTLAEVLAHMLHATIIQMDDFFLPPALRTKSRLNESGGNVHYERFCEEILPFLRKNTSFSYRCFDCHTMDYTEPKQIPQNQWYIVEGSYSMHPAFRNYMDFSIFCDISQEEQLSRIQLRNGEHMLKRFTDIWIPMEEHYFEIEQIREKCDMIVSLS